MNDPLSKLSELKLILRSDGIKYYKWIGILRDRRLLLESTINKQKVIGKILSAPSEELHIWPQLQHKNINRLLEVLCINESVKLLISPYVGNSIGTFIYDENFNKHPECFDRKKSYAKGILSALTYMHQNSVFHLNLSDENVGIRSYTDEAILCDFSFAIAQEKVAKRALPPNRHYRSPEVQNGEYNEVFDSSPIDIWDCGILLLQIFTQHQLPWRGAVNDSLEFLDNEILRQTNLGANLNKRAGSDLKLFIQHLLSEDPASRLSAKEALQSHFLQTVHNQLDEKARQFWKSGNATDSVVDTDSFIDVETTSAIYADLFNTNDSKSDSVRLNCIKSEPDNMVYREVQNPYVPGYLSSPDLTRKHDVKLTNPKNKYRNYSHFPELELDNGLCMEDDLPYFPYPESLLRKEEEELFKYPSCSLEQIIPHIISMSGIDLDINSQNSYNSLPSEALKESYRSSKSNFHKAGEDQWVDILLEHNPQSLSTECNKNTNNKKMKEKQYSRKESLKLPSENSKMLKYISRPSSPKLIDKTDLYVKPQTDVVKDDQFPINAVKTRQRKKWYRCLCCGSRKKTVN